MAPLNAKNSVTIVRDTLTERPELWLDVCIIGDRYEQNAFAEMLVPARCSKKELPEDADVVIFTGGIDVNPALYGEDAHPSVTFDTRRDEADMVVYQQCIEQGIPMFGVCRGAQFLHVMNGGKLNQDVDNHNGDHGMWDPKDRRFIDKISSVHHQMVIPNPDGGMIVLHDAHINKSKTGPLDVAEYSELLMVTTEGKCYSVKEMQELLEEAGFTDVAYKPTILDRSIVTARK